MTNRTRLSATGAVALLTLAAGLAAAPTPASADTQPGFCALHGCLPRYNGGPVQPRPLTVQKYQNALNNGGIAGVDRLLNRQLGGISNGLRTGRVPGFR